MTKKVAFIISAILICVLAGSFWYVRSRPAHSEQAKAFEALLKSAEQGKVKAQVKVADTYLFGEGEVEQNVFLAIYWFTKAAKQGDAVAAYALAKIYLAGEQTPQDVESGIEYLKQSVRQNYGPAQYMLGNLYRTGTAGMEENIGQALWMWRLAQDHGDPQAQALFEQAKVQYPELAKQIDEIFAKKQQAYKNADAALFMAQEYKSGEHIAQNDGRWLKWLEKSADLGNTQALYELYRLYMGGNSFVEPDEKRALKYLHLAAEKGLAQAQYEVGMRIYQNPKGDNGYQIAWQWLSMAADQGYPDAIYMSGMMRLKGLAGEKNPDVAAFAFKRAAELGQPEAQFILGKSYLEGVGVVADKAEAKKWLEMAADQGNKEAAELLKTVK